MIREIIESMRFDYEKTQDILVKNNVKYDFYMSDLYILDTKENRDLLKGLVKIGSMNAEPFISTDKKRMIELPFMFDEQKFKKENRLK